MEKLPVSLVGLKHSFGERIIDNSEIENKYGLPEGWILQKTGKEKGHAWDNGPDAPVEASLRCLETVLAEAKVDKSQIKAVFGTTNPMNIDGQDEVLLTEKFVGKAGFSKDVKVFNESWGCGGSAIGVDAMHTWFQRQPINTYAVYVTQDWPTKMVQDRNVEALFSDAVSVSLWTNGHDGLMEITDVFSAESNISYDALGITGGFWHMDGKAVSESASAFPAVVAEKLNINLNDYDIVPHQPNAKLLETLEKLHAIELHKEVSIEHGNPTCSGAFIALEKAIDSRKKGIGVNLDKDILVIPFGAGGIGAFILRNKR